MSGGAFVSVSLRSFGVCDGRLALDRLEQLVQQKDSRSGLSWDAAVSSFSIAVFGWSLDVVAGAAIVGPAAL